MGESSRPRSRGTFLTSIVVLPALAGLFGAAAEADSSKASQASMHYQGTPNGGSHCSLCKFYVPAADGKSDGSCQIVDGSISPNGYCMAFSAK
jgi:hypothetical protein